MLQNILITKKYEKYLQMQDRRHTRHCVMGSLRALQGLRLEITELGDNQPCLVVQSQQDSFLGLWQRP